MRTVWCLSCLLFAGCGDDDAGVDAGVDTSADVSADVSADTNLDVGIDAQDAATGPARVRIVAANLTSELQTYDAGHGLRILDGLDGDVLLIQEMNYRDNTSVTFEAFAQRICGAECTAVRGTGTLLPNGIVSRYAIIDSGVWDDPETDTREFVWARIDIPGDIDLWAVSLHLLTSSGTERELQARALMAFIATDVPAGDYLAIGGDFNVASGPVFDAMSARVEVSSRPTDQAGNANTNAPRNRKIDGVFVSPDLHAREIPVQIRDQSFAGGLVVDTRVFTPIDDLTPARMSDSDAEGMQHMAVVRDFQLP